MDFSEKKVDFFDDETETFFDEHIIREDLSSNKKEQDANVEERMRNYKNPDANLALSERMSKAPDFYVAKTSASQRFISPFSIDGTFDFNYLTPMDGQKKSGFFIANSENNIAHT